LVADRVLVTTSTGTVAALFEGDTTFIENARIANLTADNIAAKSIDADEILIDGTLVTELIANNAVSGNASYALPGEYVYSAGGVGKGVEEQFWTFIVTPSRAGRLALILTGSIGTYVSNS